MPTRVARASRPAQLNLNLIRWILPLLALSTALAQSPPSVGGTPVAGSGSSQNFTFTFSDPDGAPSIASAEVTIAATFSQFPACDVMYNYGSGFPTFWLNDDSATGIILGPLPANQSPESVSNSLCTLTNPGVTISGNQVTLTFTLTFSPAFGGPKGVWAIATDSTGRYSGWIPDGSWTVPLSDIPPTVRFTNTSRAASDGVFQIVHDWWQNVVTGGAGRAIQQVTVAFAKNGVASAPAGKGPTDVNGNLTLNGNPLSGAIGYWSETWYVGSVAATPTFGFSAGPAPTIVFQNTTNGNNTTYQAGQPFPFHVGDPWQITATGAPYQTLSLTATCNGSTDSRTIGTTGADGTLIVQGQISSSAVGIWAETWYIGGGTNPATPVLSFTVLATIGGQVTASGVGLAGVTVTLGGSASASAITGADGKYSFPNLPVGVGYNYSVSAALSGYNFGPPQNFTNLSSNQIANFAAAQYLLTAFANPAPGGAVSLSGGQAGWYNPGDSATVTAIAASGYEFSGFGGALSGITNPRTITITAPASVLANFTPIPTTTVTSLPANLAVTVDGANCTTPCTFQWLANTTHSVTAANQSGSGVQNSFTLWSDGLAASHTITASLKAATYTATFATQYQLTTSVSNSAAGSITLSPPGGWYSSGAQVGINATTNSGWVFTGFGGGLIGFPAAPVVAMNGPVNVSANYSGDFSISAPSTITLMAGTTSTVTVSVAGQNGFADTVTFAVPTLPSAAFSPTSISAGNSTTMTFTAPTTAGAFALNLIGTSSGGVSRVVTIQLQVQDFTVTPSDATGSANSTVQYAFSIAGLGGFTGSVTIAPNSVQFVPYNPPAGWVGRCTMAPPFFSIQPGTTAVTLTLPMGDCTPTTYTIPLQFQGGGINHSIPVLLNIGPTQAFSLSSSQPSQTGPRGTTLTYPIHVYALNNFSGAVDFAVTPKDCGSATTPVRVYGSGDTSFTLDTTGCTGSGNKRVYVVGSGVMPDGQSVSGTLDLTYAVGVGPQQPDFTITALPSAKTLTAGGSDVYMLNIVGTNGFTGSVNLSAGFSGTTPTGVTSTFVMGSTAAAGTRPRLKVTTSASTPASPSGNPYTLVVTANSGGSIHTYNLSLTVNAGNSDFTPTGFVSPMLVPGLTTTVPVTVMPLNTGSLPNGLTLAVTNPPPGVTVAFANQGVLPNGARTTTMTIQTAPSALGSSEPLCYEVVDVLGTGAAYEDCEPTPIEPITPTPQHYISGPTPVSVPNNGEPATFGPFNIYTDLAPNGIDDSVLRSCQVPSGGVTVSFELLGGATGFSLTFTANSGSSLSPLPLVCTVDQGPYRGIFDTQPLANAVTVYQTGPPQLSGPMQFTMLNDGRPIVSGPYYVSSVYNGVTTNYPASEVTCQTSGSGVSTSLSWPSGSDGQNASSFDLTFTSDPTASVQPGARTLTCTWRGTTITPQGSGQVYDATPRVDLVTETTLSTGIYSITGDHFGPAQGSMSVCAGGPFVSCTQTPDFSTPTQQSIQLWTNTLIIVLLNQISATAPRYCVQVRSLGQSGQGFAPTPDGTSAPTTCAGQTGKSPMPALVVAQQAATGGPATALSAAGIIYMDPAPALPAFNLNISNTLPGDTAQYRFAIKFTQVMPPTPPAGIKVNQVPCSLQERTQYFPVIGPFQQYPAAQVTTISGIPPFGNNASIQWWLNGVQQPDFRFTILGTNPDWPAVQQALNAVTINGTQAWFAQNVAIHETSGHEFWVPGDIESTYWCWNRNDGGPNLTVPRVNTPQATGMPYYGYPGGYGVLQLDPPVSAFDIWNWRTNISSWQYRFGTQAGPERDTRSEFQTDKPDTRAYPFWVRQVLQWQEYNRDAQASDKVDWDPDPGPNFSANCQFQIPSIVAFPVRDIHLANTYWYGDAILMKMIGGAPKNYVSWDNTTAPPSWSWHKDNSVSKDIVYEFCTCTSLTPKNCQKPI